MKLSDLRGELIDYRAGAPSDEVADIDGEICAESVCDTCGHNGMEYRPFYRKGSYRAFAVCPKCGETVEF